MCNIVFSDGGLTLQGSLLRVILPNFLTEAIKTFFMSAGNGMHGDS